MVCAAPARKFMNRVVYVYFRQILKQICETESWFVIALLSILQGQSINQDKSTLTRKNTKLPVASPIIVQSVAGDRFHRRRLNLRPDIFV
jgi:hypothetical protein